MIQTEWDKMSKSDRWNHLVTLLWDIDDTYDVTIVCRETRLSYNWFESHLPHLFDDFRFSVMIKIVILFQSVRTALLNSTCFENGVSAMEIVLNEMELNFYSDFGSQNPIFCCCSVYLWIATAFFILLLLIETDIGVHHVYFSSVNYTESSVCILYFWCLWVISWGLSCG